MKTFRILSIDAWAGQEKGTWEWNQWHGVGYFPADKLDAGARAILSFLRNDLALLSKESAGRVTLEDDGYNLVIMERSNRRPLFAIEHGAGFCENSDFDGHSVTPFFVSTPEVKNER